MMAAAGVAVAAFFVFLSIEMLDSPFFAFVVFTGSLGRGKLEWRLMETHTSTRANLKK